MTISNIDLPSTSNLQVANPSGDALSIWVKGAIASSTNKDRLKRQLETIKTDDQLLRFLHRFVLFNDALAARVPFLAGFIHLTPNLFVEPSAGVEFCRQANGRIAAFVAEAASDEYRMTDDRNMVHQYLSQQFFSSALASYDRDTATFDRHHPLPKHLNDILSEARTKYFDVQGPDSIFSALGFHVGLEFFADQEFNLLDSYLRAERPELLASLERSNAYLWLSIHTVVEIGHYRAGLQALISALHFYHRQQDVPAMTARIKEGFNAFIDLQRRYYEAVQIDSV